MTTSEPALNGGETGQPLTLFAADSLASPSAQPAAASPRMTPGGFGQRWLRSFADYDPASRSWRTFQGSLLAEWETYSETWPRAGMTRNGIAYQRPPSAPLTAGTESGSLPTPMVTDAKDNPPPNTNANTTRWNGVNSLGAMARRGMWPTPRSQNGEPRNHKVWRRPDGEPQNLENALAAADPSAIGGQLSPTWVEWLQGYPLGWTEI